MVVESLGFSLDGEGAHLWLQIEKTGLNTRDLITALVAGLKIAEKDIGYSGLKDKQAVTCQWFSVPWPIAMALPEMAEMPLPEGAHVRKLIRSGKKLRRGTHRTNEFTVTLRELTTDHDVIERRLHTVASVGFPNYFGVQRFGSDGRNVDNARSMFVRRRKLSRFKRSIYLSAARSYLFNQVLAARVENGSWLQVLPGEVCMLAGSNSVFKCDMPDTDIQKRHDEHDIHTTGPMVGSGDAMTTRDVHELESRFMQEEDLLCSGLKAAGLKSERRALRASAINLQWQWIDEKTLEIAFALQRGVYATSMLGEIADLQQTEKSL